ncbi:MAG: ERCC4 domain-containing protein, partial [Planctomycetes bacterium]|nr:ERCC4 domain-containing protein [Planctomycetota bacterium]
MNDARNRIFRDQREKPKHDGLKRLAVKQLVCGDYVVERDGVAIMIVEHKSPADLYHLQLHDHGRRRRQEATAIEYGSRPECRCFLIIDDEAARLLRWNQKSAENALNVAHQKGNASSINFRYETTQGIGGFVGKFAEAGWTIVLKPAGAEWQGGYPLIEALLWSASNGHTNPLQDVFNQGSEAGDEYLQAWRNQDDSLIVPCVKQLLSKAGIDRLRKLFPDSIKPSKRICAGLLKIIYRHFAITMPEAKNEEIGNRLKSWVDSTGIPRLKIQLGLNLPELQERRDELSKQNGCSPDFLRPDLAALGLCVCPGQCRYGARNGGEAHPLMAANTCNLQYLPGVGEAWGDIIACFAFADTVFKHETREVGTWLELTTSAKLLKDQLGILGYPTLRHRFNIALDHGLIGSPTLFGELKSKNAPYRLWLPKMLVAYPFDWQHTWFMGLYAALVNGDVGNFRPRTQHERLELNRKKAGLIKKSPAGGTAAGSGEVWKRTTKGRPIARNIPYLATLIAVESGGSWIDAHLNIDTWVAAARKTLNDLYNHSKAPHVRTESWNRARKLFLVVVEQSETFTGRLWDRSGGAARGTL